MEDRDGARGLIARTGEEPSGTGNDCYPRDIAGVEIATLKKVSIYGATNRLGVNSSTSISVE